MNQIKSNRSYLVFLLHEVDGLLGLGVDVLEQLPELGHLGLAPPVQVRLALAAALRLRQPLAQAQDLTKRERERMS